MPIEKFAVIEEPMLVAANADEGDVENVSSTLVSSETDEAAGTRTDVWHAVDGTSAVELSVTAPASAFPEGSLGNAQDQLSCQRPDHGWFYHGNIDSDVVYDPGNSSK